MHRFNPVGKGRKPKFDLHLKIYDLNNVPLVSGHSYVKWHLSHSMHAEHRGRTSKCPITNHRVDYSFSKHVQHIRVSVDRQNNLVECPFELEIVQEFAGAEKITLGWIRLNLSEYVEESEALIKDSVTSPGRKRADSSGLSPTSASNHASDEKNNKSDVTEGVVRRYLMQESKINSTLKMSILMTQIDGDRHFIAPPLKTATTFGGIAGIVANEQPVDDEAGPTPNISKYPRDMTEVQDLYRRTLAASWSRLPNELPADECIEDIFSGGNGWRTANDSSQTDTEEDDDAGHGTLRPSDFRKMGGHHHRHKTGQHGHGHNHNHNRTNSAASGTSDKSTVTVTGRAGGAVNGGKPPSRGPGRDDGRRSDTSLSRSGSLTSLTTASTLAVSEQSWEANYGRQREVDESEAREDLKAWRLPS